ncbi:hypothetical protein Aperf_G00000062950 [Anoplocephala perfoliata]
MSDVKTVVVYKDSNGVDKFGAMEEVDDKLDHYCIVPFSGGEEIWVSKDYVVQYAAENLNEDFIRLKLNSAISMSDDVISDMDSTARSPLKDKNWTIGQVCVCQWCGDNQWYFAEITAISPGTRACDVRFLYYNNSQYLVSIDHLHPVNSETVNWVEDPFNTEHAYELLTAANWPTSGNNSRKEGRTGKCVDEKTIEGLKEAAKKVEQHKRFKPEEKLNVPGISCFWLSSLAKKYESEEAAIRKLIFKQYKLGYDVGFEMVMKTKYYRKD